MDGSSRFGVDGPSPEWQARNPDWDRTRPDDLGWTPDPKDAGGDLRKAKTETERDRQLPIEWFQDIVAVVMANDFVGGVLSEGSAAVVYGESNSGKSFWTLDLALHIAAGRAWNGRRVTQGGVLYVAMEGATGFRNRVAAWRDHTGTHNDQVMFAAIPAALNLRVEDDAEELIATAKQAAEHWGQPVKLIVIDTVSRALAGGDENSSVDMGALVQMVDLIRKETRACVVLIHHSGKDGGKGARGHSLLRAAVDTEIEIKAGDDGVATATITKQRDLEKGGRFAFRLERVVIGQNQYGEDVTTAVVMPTEAPTTTAKPARALTPEAETLRRAIVDMVAEGEAQPTIPEPGMPEVPAISRAGLRERLIRNGWLQTVALSGLSSGLSELSKPVEGEAGLSGALSGLSSGLSGQLSGLSSGLSGGWKVPNGEQTKLWKGLNYLKARGIIGYNRGYVWLVRS